MVRIEDYQAQRKTLCRWMIDRDAIPDLNAAPWPATGWTGRHLLIARVFLALRMEGEPTDFVTVTDALIRRGWFEDVGGMDYLADLLKEAL